MNPADHAGTVPSSPGLNEKLTGQLRWVGATLQQEWEDLNTYVKTWRDVPTVLMPVKET